VPAIGLGVGVGRAFAVRRWVLLVALAFTSVLAGAALGQPSRAESGLEAAGSGGHAWLAVEQSWREETSWDLYYTSAEDEPGTLTRVMRLDDRPLAVIAHGAEVYLVSPARSAASEAVEGSVRPVRSVTAATRGAGGVTRFAPAGRGRVEAPLPGAGVVIGSGETPEGPAVVVRASSDRGAGRALVLTGTSWEERALPAGLDAGSAWRVARVPGGLAVGGGGSAWVWDDTRGWRESDLSWVAGEALVPAGEQVVACAWREGAGLELSLVRGGERYGIGAIGGARAAHAAVGVGDDVAAYWFDGEETGRLRVGVVSSISGEVVYEGFAGSASPLRREDLQVLSLVAASVLLIVILFLVRPEGDLHREPVLPEGAALAEPTPRLFAALIDVAPAAAGSAAVFGVPVWAAVSPGLSIESGAGLLPVILTAALYFGHSALCEWAVGWTVGKRLTGCRTVDAGGRPRLRLRQAVMRNLFKAVFPPLTILLLLDPSRRHPADQVSGTVVVAPGPGEAGDEGGGEGDGG